MSAESRTRRRYAPPSFAHLRRLTDDTGILEHALGRIPRRREGYTTDDNARALWVVTEWLCLGDQALDSDDRRTLAGLAEIYMAFLLWTQRDDGWWHNNISYDRTPEEEELSFDCQARTIWAAADAWIRLEGPLRHTARDMLQKALPTLGKIDSRRGQAFTLAACAHLLEAGMRGAIDLPDSWKEQLNRHLLLYENALNDEFRQFSDDKWRWFEPAMTYSNGIMPWALLRAYRVTNRQESLQNGLDSLSFLLEKMTAKEGWLRPIGNNGWGSPDAVSQWDQQPLEMFKLALALEEAAAAVEHAERMNMPASVRPLVANAAGAKAGGSRQTEEYDRQSGGAPLRHTAHLRAVRDLCLAWFYGDNDKQQPMCDPEDGSCCDGLMESGPNVNCGAESTISYLMTEALCRREPAT